MSGINSVHIVGNLARDPEVRSTGNGKIVNLTVVTSEQWKDRTSGERKERAEFHRVVLFSEHACDIAERYLNKGSLCGIHGQLQTRKWQDQNGAERYSTEVVVGKFKGDLYLLGGGKSDRPAESRGGGYADLDDDIPF